MVKHSIGNDLAAAIQKQEHTQRIFLRKIPQIRDSNCSLIKGSLIFLREFTVQISFITEPIFVERSKCQKSLLTVNDFIKVVLIFMLFVHVNVFQNKSTDFTTHKNCLKKQFTVIIRPHRSALITRIAVDAKEVIPVEQGFDGHI